VQGLTFRALLIISLTGGALGATLLLVTSPKFFAALVPWLVLFATAVFAWGNFRRPGLPRGAAAQVSARTAAVSQLMIATYGGYYGGGMGFLMLAVLTMAGQEVRNAMASKNVLGTTLNAAAVLVLAFSPAAHWREALFLGSGAVGGGILGTWMLARAPERLLRISVVVIGLLLTIGLFVTG
jgi:uncharacterized membrane protein YfcA